MQDQLKSTDPEDSVNLSVIVVAAGMSTRMQGVDKLDLEIGGRPILWSSIDVFDSMDVVARLVVVTHASKIVQVEQNIEKFGFSKPCRVVAGGMRRQDSVRNGITALEEWEEPTTFIAVHDAARPFADPDMIRRGLIAAQRIGAAIPVVPLKDTVKRVEYGVIVDTPDRSSLFAVQTPQIFRTEVLRAAHETVSEDVTDDASMVEIAGGIVGTFEGSHENIKITTPSDIALANAISVKRTPSETAHAHNRYGIGFDGHALTHGGPLRLGGEDIDFDMHLKGHSDGDVLLHAVASAILGAAGLGDLGGNFPSTDPRYAGADSAMFVSEAAGRTAELGWRIDHVDATVIAQRPRLATHIPAFRANIARIAEVDEDRINVKVTSTDEVGAIGNGEGIAAQAIVTLCR